MFVSRKKLKALVDENVALKKQNRELMADNERLSDSNLDLWWDGVLLSLKLMQPKSKQFGAYFYKKEGEISDNQSK